MSGPRVSVIMETVSALSSADGGSLAERLAEPLAALARQTYPQHLIQPILVIGAEVTEAERREVALRHPGLTLATSAAGNYFDAKNVGVASARGGIVTFLDGDCIPQADWLEKLVAPLAEGADVVAGYVRYHPRNALARALSVPDFGYIVADEDGGASGFSLGNVAFRREILLANPLDHRLVRNGGGGCYNLYHRLKAKGARIVYAPGARVLHGLDWSGLGFIRKHWGRGYDGLEVYRLDSDHVFRGTRWYRRFGILALVALSARRTLVDWHRIVRYRRQIGIGVVGVPFYAMLAMALRGVELGGSIAAHMRKERIAAPPPAPLAGAR
jgi:hypothetical protein